MEANNRRKRKLHYSRIRPLAILVAALLAAGGLAGCLGGDDPAPSNQGDGDNTDNNEETRKITIGVPAGWIGEEMRSYMLEYLLEEEYGYDVTMYENVEAGPIYQGLGAGTLDIFVGAWLPIQNEHLNSQPEGSILRIGHNLPPEEVTLGMGVPKYLYDQGITSMADLSENAELFDSTIIGPEPGFGMMIEGEKRIEANYYDLDDWTLQAGSTMGMLAAYDDAVKNEEPIVIIAWEPHYMFAKWKGDQQLVYLEDPGYETEDGETVYFYKEDSDAATVETLVPSSLPEEHPEVAGLLERFQVPVEDENQMMLKLDEGGDEVGTKDIALEYLENNPDRVQHWLGNE